MVRINIFRKISQKSAEKNYLNYYNFFKTRLKVTNEVLLELQCMSSSKFGSISEKTNVIYCLFDFKFKKNAIFMLIINKVAFAKDFGCIEETMVTI